MRRQQLQAHQASGHTEEPSQLSSTSLVITDEPSVASTLVFTVYSTGFTCTPGQPRKRGTSAIQHSTRASRSSRTRQRAPSEHNSTDLRIITQRHLLPKPEQRISRRARAV